MIWTKNPRAQAELSGADGRSRDKSGLVHRIQFTIPWLHLHKLKYGDFYRSRH